MALLWTDEMRRWLAAHQGIITISKLVELGCPVRDAYRLAHSDEFEMLMPGVLRSTHWPLGRTQLMLAACLRNSSTLVRYTTAAEEWKFRGMPKGDGEVHILVPHGVTARLPGVVVTQTRQLDPVDIVTRADGVRLTSPPRTLFDCADLLGPARTTSIFEQLLDERKGTYVTYASTVARLADPSRAGTRVMREVIASRPAWQAAMQSELEVLVLAEIARQGLPRPDVQYRIRLTNGLNIRFDFAWPHKRAGLEVDHPFWHAGATSSHRDKHRDLSATADGWLTMRITDLHVATGLRVAIAQVAASLAHR